MDTGSTSARCRVAGWVTIAGTTTMSVGAAVGGGFGTFVDGPLETGTFGEYLTHVAAHGVAAQVNVWLWILGVIGVGLGGVLLSGLGDPDAPATKVARFSFTAGPAAAMVFYPMLLGVVVELAPRHVAGEEVESTARALAYVGTTADWIATALILGLGIVALAYAGKDTWVPRWLFRWALLVGVFGVVSMVGTIIGARSTVSMVILPVAITWLIAAGITAIRRAGTPQSVS